MCCLNPALLPLTTSRAGVGSDRLNEQLILQKLTVQVMPNSTASNFKLVPHSAVNMPTIIRVFDAFGKLVETKSRIASNTNLRIGSNYRSGIYYAEAVQGNEKVKIN